VWVQKGNVNKRRAATADEHIYTFDSVGKLGKRMLWISKDNWYLASPCATALGGCTRFSIVLSTWATQGNVFFSVALVKICSRNFKMFIYFFSFKE